MLIDVRGRPIPAHEVNRGLVISTAAGATGIVFFVATGGAFLTGFARKLGASEFEIGLLNGFVPLAALAQLASSYMIERKGWLRKPVLCIAASVMRLLWIPILLLPFALGYTSAIGPTHAAKALAIYAALAIMLISQLLNSFGGLAWQAWMGDLVPADRRGRFFGVRTTAMNAVYVVAGIAIGRYLDVDNSFHAFAVVFGVGVVFGVMDLVIHAFVPEPRPHLVPSSGSFFRLFAKPFGDKRFASLIWLNVVWGFAIWIMGPFLAIYQLETLKMSYLAIANLGNLFMVAMMGASLVVGKMVDRAGGRAVLVWTYIVWAWIPAFWLTTSPHSYLAQRIVTEIVAGAVNAGAAVTQSHLLIANSPREERSIYIAVFASVTGLAGGLAPLLGGWIGDLVAGQNLQLLGVNLSGLKVVFAISLVMRLACLPMLRLIVDAGDERRRTPQPLA